MSRPQVNGIVKARLFVEGGDVKIGQALYQIDAAPYKATYDQAQAQLLSAQANLATVKAKADRYADLVKINAVAKQDNDDAAAASKQGVATVAQNKASVESARINLNYTKVTAPISGRIGRSLVTPGALVTSGQTTALATIQTLDPIYVDVTQSADQLLALKRATAGGQLTGASPQSAKVKLLLQDGTPYPIDGDAEVLGSDGGSDHRFGDAPRRVPEPQPASLAGPLRPRCDRRRRPAPGHPRAATSGQPQREGPSHRLRRRRAEQGAAAHPEDGPSGRRRLAGDGWAKARRQADHRRPFEC